MKKLFITIIFLLSTTLFAKLIDFGIVGVQYQIVEENGNDAIQRAIKDLNTTELESMMKVSVEKAFTSNSVNFTVSKKDSSKTIKDLVPVRFDIKDIDGKILHKKGSKIVSNIPKGLSFSLCFLDAGVPIKVVLEVVSTFGKKCIYFVNNIDSREFEKIYKVKTVPIGGQNEIYTNRFNIKVLPTKITKFEDMLTTETLDIQRISIKTKGL